MSTTLRLPYLATAAVSGALFGAGLYVSQMVDPLKVLRLLDPSLAFVILPAILVMFVAIRLSRRRAAPLFNGNFHNPEFTRIDAPLVVGAALFGIGWGMSGICPGPAISLVAFWPHDLLVFLVALFAGSYAGAFVIPSGENKRLAMAR